MYLVFGDTSRGVYMLGLAGLLLLAAAIVGIVMIRAERKERPKLTLAEAAALRASGACDWGASPKMYHRIEHDVNKRIGLRDDPDELIAVARMHKGYLVLYSGVPLVLALVALVVAFKVRDYSFQANLYHTDNQQTTTNTIHPPFWESLVALAVVLVAASVLPLVNWLYSFRVLASRRYIIMRESPFWVPMKNDYHALPLNRVGSGGVTKSVLAKMAMIDVGEVDADSNEGNRNDLVYKTKWTRQPDEWSGLIVTAKRDYMVTHPEVRDA